MTELAPNPIDVLVAAIVLVYAFHGYQQGWLWSIVELVGFALALFLGLTAYVPVSRWLMAWTPLPYGISKPAAFLLLWALSDLVYGIVVRNAVGSRLWQRRRPLIDRLLGAWPAAVRGLLVATLLLTISSTIPFADPVQALFRDSVTARALQPRGSVLADQFSQVFGDAVRETIGLLTVRPESNERVDLNFKIQTPGPDATVEARMVELVNRERAQHGLSQLQADETLREIARRHSADMFRRGYFAHVNPDGQTPFDRMRLGGARFRAAGENLALAPTVDVAHSGLMNSPGHRANILNGNYGRIGIGVADGGLHGKMYTQLFAD